MGLKGRQQTSSRQDSERCRPVSSRSRCSSRDRRSIVRLPQPRQTNPTSAPSRVTSHLKLPQGWAFLSRTVSPSRSFSANPNPPIPGCR